MNIEIENQVEIEYIWDTMTKSGVAYYFQSKVGKHTYEKGQKLIGFSRHKRKRGKFKYEVTITGIGRSFYATDEDEDNEIKSHRIYLTYKEI